jgi:hypothetical protein
VVPTKAEGLYNAEDNTYREVQPSLGYHVIEWKPTQDGSGEATAVCLVLPININGKRAEIMMRLKSRERVDELIATLEKHRDGVWPRT